MAHLPGNRSRRWDLAEGTGGLLLVAASLYAFPILRHTFCTADGWRLLRYCALSWARDIIRSPAIGAVVFIAASAVVYFGIRLVRR